MPFFWHYIVPLSFAPCFSTRGSSSALYQWLEADRQGRDQDAAATGKCSITTERHTALSACTSASAVSCSRLQIHLISKSNIISELSEYFHNDLVVGGKLIIFSHHFIHSLCSSHFWHLKETLSQMALGTFLCVTIFSRRPQILRHVLFVCCSTEENPNLCWFC